MQVAHWNAGATVLCHLASGAKAAVGAPGAEASQRAQLRPSRKQGDLGGHEEAPFLAFHVAPLGSPFAPRPGFAKHRVHHWCKQLPWPTPRSRVGAER